MGSLDVIFSLNLNLKIIIGNQIYKQHYNVSAKNYFTKILSRKIFLCLQPKLVSLLRSFGFKIIYASKRHTNSSTMLNKFQMNIFSVRNIINLRNFFSDFNSFRPFFLNYVLSLKLFSS